MTRLVVVFVLGACGPATRAPASAPMVPGAKPAPAVQQTERDAVDLFTALGAADDTPVGWISMGPLQLEAGGTMFEPATTGPLPVAILEHQGGSVHIAVRLTHVRFGAWIDAVWLHSILARDQRVSAFAGDGRVELDPTGVARLEVVLRAGANVRRLQRTTGWTQIRYLGAFEVTGWVPDSVLVEATLPPSTSGYVPTTAHQLMIAPGAVIRAKPEWAARELAVMNRAYLVDSVRAMDDAWSEVSYRDHAMSVHGYVSQRLPPGQLHRPHAPEAATPMVPNAIAPSGTCLYARENGEPIGYIVGDHPVELGDSGAGWWTLVVETPWSAVAFAAQGPTRTALVACAPPDSVPAPVAPPATP